MTSDEVTAREAAEITGLGERTIRRMIEDGRIPARKIAANRYAIPRRSLPSKKQDRYRALEQRVETLEHEVQTLRVALERRGIVQNGETSPDALQGDSDGLHTRAMSVYSYTPSRAADGLAGEVSEYLRRPFAQPARVAVAYHPHVARDPDAWPDTIRGRAAFLSERCGIKYNTLRDWRELREWASIEEARAGLEARGYAGLL